MGYANGRISIWNRRCLARAGALLLMTGTLGTGASAEASRYYCKAQWASYATGECASEPLEACVAAVDEWVDETRQYENSWIAEFPPTHNPVCIAGFAEEEPPSQGRYTCFIDLSSLDSGEYINYDINRPDFVLDDGQPNDLIDPEAIKRICDCRVGQVERRGQCVVPKSCSSVGNPCDAATGNKLQTEVDYDVPGTGLKLIRSYNSAQTRDHGFGVGWTAGISRGLNVDGDNVLIQRAEGWQDAFTREEGEWRGNQDSAFSLEGTAEGYALTHKGGMVELYDTEGKLASQVKTSGHVTTYRYDAEGRVIRVSTSYGHEMTLEYDAAGHVTAAAMPGNRIFRYSYDGLNNLTGVQYPDGSTRAYHYQDIRLPNHLTGITDGNGDVMAVFAYDATGRAVSTAHANTGNQVPQQRHTLAYTGPLTTVVTDPVGEQWEYTYEQFSGVTRLVSRTSSSDHRGETRQYDADGKLLSSTDEEGRVTTYTYNAANQKMSMVEAEGTPQERVTRYEYVSTGVDLPVRVIKASVAAGLEREEITAYDQDMKVLSVTVNGFDPAGNAQSETTSFEYDDSGRVIRIDGPRLDVDDLTSISYHDCLTGAGCGQLASWSNAMGHRISFDEYDEQGLLIRSTDPLGVVTSREYDLRNRIVSVTRTAPDGESRTTTLSRDNEGQILLAVTPDGAEYSYTYDAAHNLRSVADSLGNRIEYTYDEKNNRVRSEIRDPLGRSVWWEQTEYDLRDHVTQTNLAGSVTQTAYDATGHLTSRKDPKGNPHTTHAYDGLGRLTQTTDALSNLTTFQYDSGGRLAEVSAANGTTTSYEYDDLGNLLMESSPDRGVTRYSHDAGGNVESTTDARGIVVTYSYDALNRLTAVDYPGAQEDVAIEYDECDNGTGRICRVSDQLGVVTYGYDVWGNVIAEHRSVDGKNYTTRYGYDIADRVASIVYPSGRLVEYDRDQLGRITDVRTTAGGIPTVVVAGRTWRADGPMLSQNFGNGIVESRSHDLKGRLNVQNIGTVEERSYLFDGNDNLQLLIHGAGSREYGYDSLDRLISDMEFGSGLLADYAYGYDGNGNRVSMVTAGTIRDYTYVPGSNLLAMDNRQALHHDAAGHRTSARSGRKSFEYNQAGRLSAYLKNDELKGLYEYDYLGRRLHKVKGDKQVVYHYDTSGHLIGESNGLNGSPAKDYVWAGDQPVLYTKVKRTSSGELLEKQRTYLVTDHLNTPRLGIDEHQKIVWRWDSDPFGRVHPDKDPDGDGNKVTLSLRFPGQYHDSESRLNYNWNRYYDPKTGRYISSDPIGLAGGPNTYLYAYANSNRFVDPRGLLVHGSWIDIPRFNIDDIGVDGWRFTSPSVSAWGYLKMVRLHGYARGYVNFDVSCRDDCRDWEVHDRVSVGIQGPYDVGPNLLSLGAGYGVGPTAGIISNILIMGAAALQAEHHYLRLAEQKAGPIIALALAEGPTLICLGSRL